MAAMDSLLVGTDFSRGARAAVLRAAYLAAELGAHRLRLAHALEKSLLAALGEKLGGGGEQDTWDRLRQALEALAAEVADETGVSPEPLMLDGAAHKALCEAAAEDSLLVVGAQGSGGFREFALGTTAQRLAYRASVPVLVVRGQARGGYRRVLIGTDFSDAALRAAQFAPRVAPQGELHLAHLYQGPYEMNMIHAGVDGMVIQDYREKAGADAELMLTRFLADAGLDNEEVRRDVEPGYAARRLPEIAAEREADLLVVGRSGRSAFGDALLGSVAWHVLADAPCDVLVVP